MYIEIKVNQCRSDISELDPNQNANCYGLVYGIKKNGILIKHVYIYGINDRGNTISFYIDHIWLLENDIIQYVETDKIKVGNYICFSGKPYLYTRKNNTKDWAFNNCVQEQICVIEEDEYRKYIKIEAIL